MKIIRIILKGHLTIFLAFLTVQLLNGTACAQDVITMEKTVSFVESKLKGNCTLDMKNGGKLILKYSKNGEVYREDMLFLTEMDTSSIAYQAEEKSVVINCVEGNEECVVRRLYKDNEKRFYSRVNFAFDFEPEEARVLIDALKHMILLVKDDKYKRTKPFE